MARKRVRTYVLLALCTPPPPPKKNKKKTADNNKNNGKKPTNKNTNTQKTLKKHPKHSEIDQALRL